MGKGPSEQRQIVLRSYLEEIKKENECTFSPPDLVFLQEVPWAAGGSIVKGLLNGTPYSYTADSWAKESDSHYNVVLYNEARLPAYRLEGDFEPVKLYQKLDKKRDNAMKILDEYSTDEQLQKAAADPDSFKYKKAHKEFLDRDSIEYFTNCFKRPTDSEDQKAEIVLKGRIGVGIFELRCGREKSKLIGVSFHNRHPKKEPEKLLCLLLHFLKELHNVAVVLAGDFNMDVNKVETSHVKRLLKDFKPQVYSPTPHRTLKAAQYETEPCLDNILFWDTRGVFALGPIQAHLIEVGAAGDDEMDRRESVSNHDPLTAVLKIQSHTVGEGDQQSLLLSSSHRDNRRKQAVSNQSSEIHESGQHPNTVPGPLDTMSSDFKPILDGLLTKAESKIVPTRGGDHSFAASDSDKHLIEVEVGNEKMIENECRDSISDNDPLPAVQTKLSQPVGAGDQQQDDDELEALLK